MLNYSTQEVHDRAAENKYATFKYYSKGRLRYFRGLDFKDHRVKTKWE